MKQNHTAQSGMIRDCIAFLAQIAKIRSNSGRIALADEKAKREPAPPRRAASAQYRSVNAPETVIVRSSLQTSLANAIVANGVGNDVQRRAFAETERTLLLNHYHIDKSYLFGELASFRADGLIALIQKYAGPVAELNIRQDRPAEGHDFLHGLLYFMAIGNHVIVLESSSVRSKAFAQYLTWFLGPKVGGVLVDGEKCALNAEIVIQLDDDAAEVTQAIFEPMAQRRDQAKAESREAKTKDEQTKIWDQLVRAPEAVWKLLKAAGATDASIEKALNELPEDAKLEAQLRVQARTRTHPTKISPKLINSLLNVGDDDRLTLETPSGRRVGEIGTLRHPVRILTKGDLFDRTDVERALYEAYTVFVENGRIDPVG